MAVSHLTWAVCGMNVDQGLGAMLINIPHTARESFQEAGSLRASSVWRKLVGLVSWSDVIARSFVHEIGVEHAVARTCEEYIRGDLCRARLGQFLHPLQVGARVDVLVAPPAEIALASMRSVYRST